MNKLRGISAFLRAELEAVSSLVPLIIVAVVGALVLAGTSVTMAYPAFQSPIGTPTPTPTGVPSQPPTATPVVPPAQPIESPPAGPTEVPGEVETPTGEPEPSPTQAAPEPTEVAGDTEEESRGIRGLSPAVLIDTLVVGLSSVWLCCGGIVLVLFVLGVIAAFVSRAE